MDELLPLILEMLQDSSSLQKREVCIMECTLYVKTYMYTSMYKLKI